MKKLALLLALCLFVQCIGLTVAFSSDAEIPEGEQLSEAAPEQEVEPDPVVEETKPDPVVEETKPDPVVEETKPDPVVEETNPAPVVEETKPDPVVEETNPAPVVEETNPAPVVEETNPVPVVEETKPDPVVEETKPDPVVEETNPAPVVEETKPDPVVEETNPAPVVEETNPTPVVEETNPAPVVEETNPASVVEETNPEPVVEETVEVDTSKDPSPLAELKEKASIYEDDKASEEAIKLDKKAVVLVLEKKDKVSKIAYVVLDENNEPKLCEGYAKNDELSVLTNAEADEWNKAKHSVKKEKNGYPLEPVQPVKEEPVAEELPKAETVETEPAAETIAEPANEPVAEVKAETVEEPVVEETAQPAEAPKAETTEVKEEPKPAKVIEAAPEGDLGDAASAAFTPAGEVELNSSAQEDVLGTSEFEDVLGSEGASTEFEVDAAGRVIQYNGPKTNTVIQVPIQVMRNGAAVTVTGIERSAFQGNTTVTQIILPTTVWWIDAEAFKGCTALQTINLPDQVAVISEAAFADCTSLTSVSWTDTVTIIRDRAFYGCSSLTTLGTSSNVTDIGDFAFYGCSALKSITWSDSLDTIGKYSYANCVGLTGLSFPASLSFIDDYAFAGCSNIQQIQFQGNTTLNSIGAGAFQNCSSVRAIYIPDSVNFIGNNAFENCSSATVLSLPANLTIIQDSTFRNCSSIANLSIPNGVTEIHQYAFENCSNIEWVYTIPASVNFIGTNAFYGLKSDCWIVVENAGVKISSNGLGESGNVFGWVNSTTQAYANAHAGVNFYNIQTVRYVERCYNTILNRNGDPDGVIHWSRRLALRQETGASIVHGFVFSPEFANRGLNNGQVVEILYNAMLNRSSDPAGKANWLWYLDAGCSYDYVIKGFSNAPEFDNLCRNVYAIDPGNISLTQDRDQNPVVTAFVTRCYKLIMERDPDVGGLNNWTGHLNNKRLSGGQVVADFVASPEFRGRGLSDSDQVEIMYETMLDRSSDPTGKAFWLNFLANNMTIEFVVKGFSDSVEFRFICQNYGINAGPVTPSQYRDRNPQVTLFVNRIYQYALERNPDVGSLNNLTGAIITKGSTPATVAKDVFTSLECQLHGYSNADFVVALYWGYLNRAPSAAEKTDMVNKLNSGTSRADLCDIFGGSDEFKNIVNGFGL